MSTRIVMRSGMNRTSAMFRNIRLASLFRPEDILHDSQAHDDIEVIRQLLLHLALEHGIGNFRAAQDEVAANVEKENPHIAPGVAAVYGRLEKLTDPLMAMATFPRGTEFHGETVHLVVAVLVPPDMPGAYKQVVHGLSKACAGRNDARTIATLPSPLAVWQHFDEGGHKLPDHLQARHIMSSPSEVLNSDDSLGKAIDIFLKHRVSELPVVTPDNELIGVVTTRRLVRVCMPEYLTWIEDMRPFQNFEPIADLIRKESTTWLREIMVHDFAHVEEESPAILALKEIGRRETDNAYVLRGRTLAGIIHLHEFLGSILR